MKKHYKLSPKQIETLVTVSKAVVEAEAALARAQQQKAVVVELVLDVYGINPKLPVMLDDKQGELVVHLTDDGENQAKETEEAPAQAEPDAQAA